VQDCGSGFIGQRVGPNRAMHARAPATPQQLHSQSMHSARHCSRLLSRNVIQHHLYHHNSHFESARLRSTLPSRATAVDSAIADASAYVAAPDGQRALHTDSEAAAGRVSEASPALDGPYTQRHPEFVEQLRGQLILAPLTKYGNLPFRRLCADFGANVTMGEMMYAKQLVNPKNRSEKARLRHAENERYFGAHVTAHVEVLACAVGCNGEPMSKPAAWFAGAQIATKVIDEGIRAGAMAKEAGATWLDLNAACPIYEATKRGCGARLLTK
jgi:tRNA-dihydrouridine synthase 3